VVQVEKQKENLKVFMKKMLNIGCGHRYHKEWVNIDVDPAGPEVIKADITRGLPFGENSFDVVYHSNVLEHLPAHMGINLVRECLRVLKPGGTLRINVPDLEKMTHEYLTQLAKARSGDSLAGHNYDWILIEMFDQVSRNQSGGEMAKYLSQPELPNPSYLRQRLGGYADNWRSKMNIPPPKMGFLEKLKRIAQRPEILRRIWHRIVLTKKERDFIRIGQFRLGGEVHYHMYDAYSIQRLLKQEGFQQIAVKDPVTSNIPDWKAFDLDSVDDGAALIVEAIK
jgi:predicted SAM-dependent methyltransferase